MVTVQSKARKSKLVSKKRMAKNKDKARKRAEFQQLAREVKATTGWELRSIFEKLGLTHKKGENIMADQSTPDGLIVVELRRIHARVTDPSFRNLSPEQYEDLLDKKEEEIQQIKKDKEAQLERIKHLEAQLKTYKLQAKLLLQQLNDQQAKYGDESE